MNNFLRWLWVALVVRPLALLIIGLNVRNHKGLLIKQPAIIVANHNSHLDTAVLTSVFPMKLLSKIRPVAAMDYFMCNKFCSWFALNIIGIIPVNRTNRTAREDPLAGCSQAVERGDVLILFPEGTRGEPEEISEFKSGVAHLAKRHPDVPVIPVFMHGPGKALPKGDCILVPFVCDIIVGEPIYWNGDKKEFMGELESTMRVLADEIKCPPWE